MMTATFQIIEKHGSWQNKLCFFAFFVKASFNLSQLPEAPSMVYLPTFTMKKHPNVGKYTRHPWMVWVRSLPRIRQVSPSFRIPMGGQDVEFKLNLFATMLDVQLRGVRGFSLFASETRISRILYRYTRNWCVFVG